tara:strand:+ start:416 stop:682 length:267 start_codon:yes stop_codon:yes gene_type:complete
MGGFNYNFTSSQSGYGNETPRSTNYLRLSPLLFGGSCTFLPFDFRRRVGLPIRLLSRMHRKALISSKYLVLGIVRGIKKVIAYFIKNI